MIRSSAILTILSGLLLVCSCANPATNKPKAVTSQAVPVASSSPAATGEKYLITPENSKIEFFASKVTGSPQCAFGKISGAIDYAGQPEKSHVPITIHTGSRATGTP